MTSRASRAAPTTSAGSAPRALGRRPARPPRRRRSVRWMPATAHRRRAGRDDGQHALPAADGGGGCLGQPVTPAVAGQRPTPHGRHGPPQGVEEGRTPGVAQPGGAGSMGSTTGNGGALLVFLRAGVPRRDGQPQYVRAGAGISAAATASTNCRTSPVSTGSAEITRSIQPSWPTWSVSERRSGTKASTRWPWNRTRTRGLGVVGLLLADEVVELARSRCGTESIGSTPGDGLRCSAAPSGCAHSTRIFTSSSPACSGRCPSAVCALHGARRPRRLSTPPARGPGFACGRCSW